MECWHCKKDLKLINKNIIKWVNIAHVTYCMRFVTWIFFFQILALGCTDQNAIYEEEGSQPTLSYQANTTLRRDFIVLYHVHGNTSVYLFYVHVSFEENRIYREYFDKVSPTSTYNATLGRLHLQLDSLQSGDEGLYFFRSDYTLTDRQCTIIYLLGEYQWRFFTIYHTDYHTL